MADAKPRYDPFTIDQDDLDGEWLRQSQLTRKAGYREADARHEHAQAKARLDVVEARIRQKIRRDPAVYGLKDKPTEAAITEVVTLEKEYQETLAEVNEAKHDLDIMAADVSAMTDRRKALERLVELIALDYFAHKEPVARSTGSREHVRDASRRSARASVDDEDRRRS